MQKRDLFDDQGMETADPSSERRAREPAQSAPIFKLKYSLKFIRINALDVKEVKRGLISF